MFGAQGENIDMFERHFAMLRDNEKIFERHKVFTEKAANNEQISKRGKDLLTAEECRKFMEVRSIHYHNIVMKKLEEYTFPEWLVCLNEKILLEYVVSVFSKVLKEYPRLCGMDCEWQVLYEITMISPEFWNKKKEWQVYYGKIIEGVLMEYEQGILTSFIPEKYMSQFKRYKAM